MKNRLNRGLSLSGKIILTIVVVTAVSGGFILGYFVGKNASPPPSPVALKQPLNEVAPETAAREPNTEIKNEALPATAPATAGNKQNPVEPPQSVAASPSSAPASDRSTKDDKGKTSENKREETAAKPRPSGNAGKDQQMESQNPQKKKVLYGVQAGAFNNRGDADTLKQSLDAKGYRVSVRKELDSKGSALFKVMLGEFDSKKKAAAFARKLKKTSGVNAFAAVKN